MEDHAAGIGHVSSGCEQAAFGRGLRSLPEMPGAVGSLQVPDEATAAEPGNLSGVPALCRSTAWLTPRVVSLLAWMRRYRHHLWLLRRLAETRNGMALIELYQWARERGHTLPSHALIRRVLQQARAYGLITLLAPAKGRERTKWLMLDDGRTCLQLYDTVDLSEIPDDTDAPK